MEKMKCLAENPSMVAQLGKVSREIAEQKFDVVLVNNKIKETMKI